MDNRHRLLFLDPGHFHAALTLRVPHPRVADDIVVYAPDSPERRDFLALVNRFQARWRVDVVTTDDPLGALIAERRGDVVVVAGKNGGKARAIHRLHDAGFHVLADKPWLVEPGDLDDIRASLTGPPLVAEIMTGRHDLFGRLLQRLVGSAGIFGRFRDEAPALELESLHYLAKLVDGVPLRRPWWFFDVRVQGSGIVDIPTHLVDRAQWLTGDAGEPLALIAARAWPTRVPVESFRAITGEPAVPAALTASLDGDALRYLCNAELEFSLGSVTARARCGWELATPVGGGDTTIAVAHGTHATVRLEQSPRTGHRRQLVVEPRAAACVPALHALVAAGQTECPGVVVRKRDGERYEVAIPPALDGGHETHFAHVLDQFLLDMDTLGGLGGHSGPAHVQLSRTLAKYTLLAEAVGATLRA